MTLYQCVGTSGREVKALLEVYKLRIHICSLKLETMQHPQDYSVHNMFGADEMSKDNQLLQNGPL